MSDPQSSLSSLIVTGALRSTAGFPFEHPLELLKITAQANPTATTAQIVSGIFRNEGLRGFTKTILTNFPRRVLREAIRWPVIGTTHEQLVERYPHIFTREGTASKLFTGASVALFETAVILPLEQLMAFRVKEGEKYSSFFKTRFSTEGVASLYRGISINLIRQSVLWCSIMGINNESKRIFDLFDPEKAHPFLRQGFSSLFISLGLNAWCLPIDFVKTRIQMDRDLQHLKLTTATITLLKRHRLKHFYAGALPVFIHSMFHSMLSGYILDKLFENDDKSRRKDLESHASHK